MATEVVMDPVGRSAVAVTCSPSLSGVQLLGHQSPVESASVLLRLFAPSLSNPDSDNKPQTIPRRKSFVRWRIPPRRTRVCRTVCPEP